MATEDEMIQALTDAVKDVADRASQAAGENSMPLTGGWAAAAKALAEALSAARPG